MTEAVALMASSLDISASRSRFSQNVCAAFVSTNWK